MTVTLHVSERGLQEATAEVRSTASRLGDLSPVAPMVRKRWHESEQRTFRRGFAPLQESSIRRYRWPVDGARGGQPGRLSGDMHRALTRPGREGITEDETGNLQITLGASPTGPVPQINWFDRERQVVEIDDRAVDDAAEDITDWLDARAGRRSGRW